MPTALGISNMVPSEDIPYYEVNTVDDVDTVVDQITRIESAIDVIDDEPRVLPDDAIPRLREIISWIQYCRTQFEEAKDKFSDDSETTMKIENGLEILETMEEQCERLIRQSDELEEQLLPNGYH
ncbi:hypothetical protein F4677DRAFT_440379 [Hypoxylon crocopeplum]|nr:hypothetical protein F4677DRAFT_440379 [Hypoxylon crocopeplum]